MSRGFIDVDARKRAMELYHMDTVPMPQVDTIPEPGSHEAQALYDHLKPHYYSRLARITSSVLNIALSQPLKEDQEFPSDDPWENLQDDLAMSLKHGVDHVYHQRINNPEIGAAKQLHAVRAALRGTPGTDLYFSLLGGAGTGARVVTNLLRERVDAMPSEMHSTHALRTLQRDSTEIRELASINTLQLSVLQNALEHDAVDTVTYNSTAHTFRRERPLLEHELTDIDRAHYQETIGQHTTAASIADLLHDNPIVGCPVLLVQGAVKRLHEYTLDAAIDRGLVPGIAKTA